jgi:hypothetical protein
LFAYFLVLWNTARSSSSITCSRAKAGR